VVNQLGLLQIIVLAARPDGFTAFLSASRLSASDAIFTCRS